MFSWKRRLACAVLAVEPALAQAPALTTVQDVLYTADGNRYNGQISIVWRSFQSTDSANVGAQSKRLSIVNGNLYVQLVPTASTEASGAYTVQYSAGKAMYTEYWVIPSSSTPLRVRDVRLGTGAVTTPGSTSGPPPGGAVTLQISDVSGLQSALSLRPSVGTAFAVSRAAVINSLGAIDGAIGSLSDCLHVDGTSGACGSGSGGSAAAFVDSEIPAGTVNGSNTAFTLANAPVPGSSLTFFRNGLLLRQNSDYTLSNRTVTFLPGAVPQNGDLLLASYRLTASLPGVGFVDSETPTGALNGVNASFTLVQAPNPSASLAVYRNGVRQKPGSDYNTNANAITFTAGAVPQTGDVLWCSYRIAQ